MATFYLLPPRPLVADRFAAFLGGVLPGLDWSRTDCGELVDLVSAVAASRPGVYLVFREELAEDQEPAAALAEDFGADAGDEVIEVRAGARPGELMATRWRVRP